MHSRRKRGDRDFLPFTQVVAKALRAVHVILQSQRRPPQAGGYSVILSLTVCGKAGRYRRRA
jgi:hypothetical protein